MFFPFNMPGDKPVPKPTGFKCDRCGKSFNRLRWVDEGNVWLCRGCRVHLQLEFEVDG